MPVDKGNNVKIEYTGKLDDGTVFDSSEKQGKPLEFEVGAGVVIPGFDNAILGMEKGEEKEFKIEPNEGYGDRNEELIKEVPKDKMPKEVEPKEGMMLIMATPQGQQIPTKIVKVGDETITLDMNHPLAGQTLNFNIKLVEYS